MENTKFMEITLKIPFDSDSKRKTVIKGILDSYLMNLNTENEVAMMLQNTNPHALFIALRAVRQSLECQYED